ncbi:hypothetical protein U1Q18_036553, partial [Sarracenia purpurea var. burkii]
KTNAPQALGFLPTCRVLNTIAAPLRQRERKGGGGDQSSVQGRGAAGVPVPASVIHNERGRGAYKWGFKQGRGRLFHFLSSFRPEKGRGSDAEKSDVAGVRDIEREGLSSRVLGRKQTKKNRGFTFAACVCV